ncbi:unnamed protein product [Ostreobium quekettii]|uniref:RecA family profile 1 domain-containing protein n=1 Tax=Ostreobium quekettii TaxID=121088 RepID=A0A8S1IVR9_9CHLO|nr:unnamed protein product [Ostreobium quekettii]|eukprot:evm.model.scf_3206.1 EVM.evm.TU.scf_3206.1   scf_3206:3312-10381(+)
MATRPLARMGIEATLLSKLKARNLNTAQDVLTSTQLDLIEILEDVTETEIEALVLAVSKHVAPTPARAYELQHQTTPKGRHLPTCIQELDTALRGGIPSGSLTELVGPAGVGKTQFCLQLSVSAAKPRHAGGLGRHVHYFDTEKKFTSNRVAEIAEHQIGQVPGSKNLVEETLANISVMRPGTAGELLQSIKSLESSIIELQVGLVLLDSVAALVRTGYGHEQLVERQEMLGLQAASLKYLAQIFDIPVVVTNQVMARFQTQSTPGPEASIQAFSRSTTPLHGHPDQGSRLATAADSSVMAALGTKWAHCVNTRLVLERVGQGRCIKIAKSPSCPNAATAFRITHRGVETDHLASGVADLEGDVLAMGIANDAAYDM